MDGKWETVEVVQGDVNPWGLMAYDGGFFSLVCIVGCHEDAGAFRVGHRPLTKGRIKKYI